MNGPEFAFTVPFKTPADYYRDLLGSDPAAINEFYARWMARADWRGYDEDLHVYPYTHALPAALSFGCPNRCPFCPTAELHQGRIVYGDPSLVLPPYRNRAVHFMDENFFAAHRGEALREILRLLRAYRITWLCMSDARHTLEAFDRFGEEELWASGLRVVEVGLENVAHYRKVPPSGIPSERIQVYYLNMTFFPGETKESIRANAEWMRERSIRHPIHHNNGLWYAPGQYLFDSNGTYRASGQLLCQPMARTRPTFIPASFAGELAEVVNLERANFFAQLVYGVKFYPATTSFRIGEWCGADWRRWAWTVVGIRSGGLR
jgi:hypothetical protein